MLLLLVDFIPTCIVHLVFFPSLYILLHAILPTCCPQVMATWPVSLSGAYLPSYYHNWLYSSLWKIFLRPYEHGTHKFRKLHTSQVYWLVFLGCPFSEPNLLFCFTRNNPLHGHFPPKAISSLHISSFLLPYCLLKLSTFLSQTIKIFQVYIGYIYTHISISISFY